MNGGLESSNGYTIYRRDKVWRLSTRIDRPSLDCAQTDFVQITFHAPSPRLIQDCSTSTRIKLEPKRVRQITCLPHRYARLHFCGMLILSGHKHRVFEPGPCIIGGTRSFGHCSGEFYYCHSKHLLKRYFPMADGSCRDRHRTFN